MLPKNAFLKFEAKKSMGRSLPLWIKATFLLVGLEVAFLALRGQIGGLLGVYMLKAESFPGAVSGYFPQPGGFQLIARVDELGAIWAISLTYGAVIRFLLVNLLIFMVVAPLKLATMERYWSAFRGEMKKTALFRWYTQPKLMGKALVVEGVVDIFCRTVSLLVMAASYGIIILIYQGVLPPIMGVFGMVLMLGGMLFAFWLYTRLLPIRYCLAAQPDDPLRKVFEKGRASIRGYERQFFGLMMSMLPWYILSVVVFVAMDLYVLPYVTFVALQFLQEVANHRRESGMGEPEVPVIPQMPD